MEPPGGGEELCILLVRDGGAPVSCREVGCQWESPQERREVGCQSRGAETRDAGVQVDLLGSSAVLLQCLTVRPDGADGGALLQHCTPNRTRTRTIRPAVKLCDEPTETRTRTRKSSSTVRRSRQRSGSPDLPQQQEEEEEEVQEEEVGEVQEEVGEVEEFTVGEETGDPTWTPKGDTPPSPPSDPAAARRGALLAVKLEPDSTVCDVCGKVMKSKSSLARHSFIHTGKKPFSCHLCDLRFNRRDNLQHHLSRLHPGGAARRQKQRLAPAWLCAVCGKTFSCRSRLKTHEVIHSGVKPFRCDLCPKAYMRSNDLEHHRKVVHVSGAARPPRPASLLCHLCGKEFRCRSQLAVHLQTHTGERPHLCDVCGRKFGRQYQLRRHKILTHRAVAADDVLPPGAGFACGVCGKRLKSEALLAAHARVHAGDKPHRCGVCLRGFQRAACLKHHQLQAHLRADGGQPPHAAALSAFPCHVCGKVFRFRSLLASHALIHSDVRPFSCDFCSRSFRRLGHLKRHRQVVHADGARLPQTYVCHICGKDKKCRSQLARHVIIHTGERPFTCDLCPARFNRRGNLQQHQRRMHGVGRPAAAEDTPLLFEDDEDGVSCKQEEAMEEETVDGGVASEPCDPLANEDAVEHLDTT
ncbi:zinc finger protein 436 isoform X2 [Fundulus heteroclitus]|uniref:zinc finger protein 436 isoform X2 n=1 Tax=Fundulus heteroclitus TaxID=8078 RepID=UPI00165B036E|nr:zinc finger protein 436 isoform X2 [Fundulus heteroclitus]